MKLILSVLAVVGTVICGTAHAATYCYWSGPNGGEWSNAANWKNGRVPTVAGDVARLSTNECPNCGTLISLDHPEGLALDRIEALAGEWTIELGGTLTFTNGSATAQTIDVNGSSKLTFEGGKIVGASYRVTTQVGTTWSGKNAIVFKNTVNENAATYSRAGNDEGDTFTVDGGVHQIRTWYPRLNDHMVVNGGIVNLGSIVGTDRHDGGRYAVRRDDSLSVKGGKVVIDGTDADVISSSIGICASDRGIVEIAKNAVKIGANTAWLVNGNGYKCAWRVEDKALFTAYGPYVVGTSGTATGNVEVAGGRFVMTSSFSNTAGSNTGRYSNFIVDGGVLDFDYSADGSLAGTKCDVAGTAHKLVAGPKGARLRNRNNVAVTISNGGFVAADEGTGGVTFDGRGTFKMSTSMTYGGGVTVRGSVQPTVASGTMGTGTVTLRDCGVIRTDLASTALPTIACQNAGTIFLGNNTANLAVPSVTGVGSGSLLVLSSDATREAFGTTDGRFVVSETAPALDDLGLPTSPVVAVTKESNNSAAELHLLTYDSQTKKFVAAEYETDDLAQGEGKIVCLSKTSVKGDSAKAGAVVLQGAALSGKTTIGNGSGNAYLVLLAHSNSSNQGQLTGGGTVSFNGARGYVLSGAGVNGAVNCGINGYLSGTAGIVFYSQSNGGIKLYRAQNYTGGTKIIGGIVELTASGNYLGNFGSGAVEVVGGEYTGGTVRFGNAATYQQDYTISGFGATQGGALDFRNDVTLAGQVTLVNDAMVCAAEGKTGTFSKAIKGDGDLYLGGEGAIAVPGVDIAGDLHVTGNVTSEGSILTGERFLFLDGTLTLNNAEDVTIDAKVLGNGTLVLAGTGKVNVSDLSVFEGTIDLAGHPAALNAFSGVAKIVNSGDAKVDLTVSGATPYAFFGEIGADIDLMLPGQLLFGYGATIPATAALTLDGGTIGLGAATTLAALSGDGTVSGQKLTVTGAVTPTEFEPGETVLSFGRVPEFQTALDGKWRLKAVGLGAELAKRRGMILIVR